MRSSRIGAARIMPLSKLAESTPSVRIPSLFAAAHAGMEKWAKFWWYSPDAVIEVRDGERRWLVRAQKISAWRAARFHPEPRKIRPITREPCGGFLEVPASVFHGKRGRRLPANALYRPTDSIPTGRFQRFFPLILASEPVARPTSMPNFQQRQRAKRQPRRKAAF